MATVDYWFASWVSAGDDSNDLWPNDTHEWIMWGFSYGDMIDLTAQPLHSPDIPGSSILRIENKRVEMDDEGPKLLYTIRNVGTAAIRAYGVGFSWISA